MMQSLGQQLNGTVQLKYDRPGFVYSLDVPLSSVAARRYSEKAFV
jgi:hypothetical protein